MTSVEKMLAKKPKYVLGLAQALGLAAYVLLFVTAATNLVPHFEKTVPFMLGAMMFLMAFVTSALICGSLLLGYPLWLVFQKRAKDAVLVVAWSVVWLMAILAVCLSLGFLLR